MSLLPLCNDVVAVVWTIGIDHPVVSDCMHRGRRQLDEHVVREQNPLGRNIDAMLAGASDCSKTL